MGPIHTLGKSGLRNGIILIIFLFPLLLQAQFSVNFLRTDASCFGVCDGSTTAVAFGGMFPYTFLWSTGKTTASMNGLCAGAYTVTVTDATQNTVVGTVTIIEPNQITVEVHPQDQICGIAPDGVATAVTTGGTAPYTYLWSNDSTGPVITGLEEGTYTVTVTDFGGCTAVNQNFVFFQNEGIWLTDSVAHILCFGDDNGFGHVGPMTGTMPYTYSWSNGDSTQDILNLMPGTYTVTVTDVNGCSNSTSVTVQEPPPLNALIDSLPALCVLPGSATVTPSGGTPGYTVLWSNGDTTLTAAPPAGPVSVTLTDANGCEFVLNISIPDSSLALQISTNILGNALCLLGGSASAAATGGSGNFSYLWSNGDSTAVADNLSAGMYTVTITESPTGCTGTATATVVALPSTLNVEATANSPASCLIGGSASAIASGGMPPYVYIWDNGDTTATVSNLSAGAHVVLVVDSAGCTATDTIQILLAPLPGVQAQVKTPVSCATGGSAIATAASGLPPYSYLWNTGDTTATASNLQAGTFTVTVTDSGGCTATATVALAMPQIPTVAVGAIVAATCASPGSATASASGGVPPYTYFWDNGDTTAQSVKLSAGQHFVTATDAGGCSASVSVFIPSPPLPTAFAQMDSVANCLGSGGGASASASGGNSPYTFLWSNGNTTSAITNAGAGSYTVTVTDAGGCKASAIVTIQAAQPPTLSLSVTANATCTTLGSIQANPSGGSSPYAYLWSSGQTTATISGAPGVYTLTITDAEGCTATSSATIGGPLMPTVDIVNSTSASCAAPGSALAVASGGAPPYIYLWDNGETNAQAVNLSAGTHTVSITDTGGCTATDTVVILLSSTGGIKIGDYVWFDNDQDGFQHPLEKGAPNITVKLLLPGPDSLFHTPDDITVASTQTDSTGKYRFECITPGRYVLVFSGLPANHEFTGKDKGNNDCKDSDANKQGRTDPFLILAGQSDNLCLDAGIHFICDNVTYAGIVCCTQTICEGEVPELLYEVVPPAGGTGPLQYLWLQFIQVGPAPPSWTGIPGATNADYQPGPLFETAYFMRCVRREGCITFLESNIICVNVKPAGSPDCPSFFSDFQVENYGPTTVKIKWTTQPEMTRYLYTVERSPDQTNWQAVATRMGNEDAGSANYYQAMDLAPINGMNYYRVKRLSGTGVESYTEVRELEMQMTEESSLAIFPNPVSQLLYIRNLMAYDADAGVEIFTSNGQLLYTLNIPAGTLQNFELPLAQLPQGLYLAKVRFGDGKVKTVKLVKM